MAYNVPQLHAGRDFNYRTSNEELHFIRQLADPVNKAPKPCLRVAAVMLRILCCQCYFPKLI